MSQDGRPISDVSNSVWTPQVVFSQLNEIFPDDATFVESAGNQGDMFEVKFPKMAWPKPELLPPAKLTVRIEKTTAGTLPVTVKLMQGSKLIAFDVVYPTQTFVDYVHTLTQKEIKSITDYTNLRLVVIAGNSVSVGCCERKLPQFLNVHVDNKTGDCTCLPDDVTLAWNGLLWASDFDIAGCPFPVSFQLTCNPSDPAKFTFKASLALEAESFDFNCDPLNMFFSMDFTQPPFACTGSAIFEITEI